MSTLAEFEYISLGCVMIGNERRTCLCGDNMPLECGTDEVYEMVFETGCALESMY